MIVGELPANIRIGPSPDRLGVRVVPGSGDVPTRLLFDGPRAYARYRMAHELAGTKHDQLLKEDLSRMQEAMDRPWVLAGADFERYLAAAGLEVRIDAAAVARLEDEAERARARYSRWLPVEDGWVHHPGTIRPELRERAAATLRALGWQDLDPRTGKPWLFPFAFDSICEAATKRDTLLAWGVGLSKTRSSLSLAEVFRNEGATGPVVILALRRHLQSWYEELPKLGPLRARYGDDPASWWIDKDDVPNFNKPFLLISFERLKRLDEAQMARLAEVVKRSAVIIDEVYVLKDPGTQQSQAVRHLQGAHHISLSGTPTKGWSDHIWYPLAHTFRSGSVAFPDYRADRQGGQKAFERDYISWCIGEDGSRKRTPVLKNASQFYRMLEPLMSRRLRSEPEVAAVLGATQLEIQTVDVPFDPEHQTFYEGVLEQFSEWYRRMLRQRGTPQAFTAAEILVRLGYCRRALAQPWAMPMPEPKEGEEPLRFPEYPRQPTPIHRWAMERAIAEVGDGYQVLIFGWHTQQLDLIAERLNLVGCGVLHGRVTPEKRRDVIAGFRTGDTPILCASFGTAAESLNLGEASVAIVLEPDWSPSTTTQAEGRMLRGIVEGVPRSFRLTTSGSIYQYIWEFSALKARAMGAGLDNVAQNITGDDIPDLQAFAYAIAVESNPKYIPPRRFVMQEEEAA